MDLYKRVVKGFIDNKEKREKGLFVNIPFDKSRFKNLTKHIPGIQKGRYIGVTANSKVGKTQITDSLFVHSPLDFVRIHSDKVRLKILYFSLEMSKEDKMASLISNKLYRDKGIILSPEQMSSQYDDILSDQVQEILTSDEYVNYFKEVQEHVEIIDTIRNPTGIYYKIKETMQEHGKTLTKPITINGVTKQAFDRYVPNDDDFYLVAIIDHIGLFTIEKGLSLHQTIGKWSSTYALELRDRYKATIVNVHQQSSDSEKPQYTFKGQSIVDKLKPSTDGLGNNKEIQRDYDILLGLFAPHRYGIAEYNGYNILKGPDALRDRYRELSIIINRRGSSNLSDNLYFDGRTNFFKELPLPNSAQMDVVNKLLKK